jgi:hypothetical protein
VNTDPLTKLAPAWVVIDTGGGWIIHARCLPSPAIVSHPRARTDLYVNGRNATISLTRVTPLGWRLTAVWTGPDGASANCLAGLDRGGLCAACDREIIDVGVTEEGIILVGHRGTLI